MDKDNKKYLYITEDDIKFNLNNVFNKDDIRNIFKWGLDRLNETVSKMEEKNQDIKPLDSKEKKVG